jgi:cytochrome c oxidase assembly factor 6
MRWIKASILSISFRKMKFPSRSERDQCYATRDAYFKCLDEHDLWLQGLKPTTYDQVVEIDPLDLKLEPDTRKNAHLYTCRQFKLMWDQSCLPSWVQHFSLLRVKELQTKALKQKLEQQTHTQDSFWENVQQERK